MNFAFDYKIISLIYSCCIMNINSNKILFLLPPRLGNNILLDCWYFFDKIVGFFLNTDPVPTSTIHPIHTSQSILNTSFCNLQHTSKSHYSSHKIHICIINAS